VLRYVYVGDVHFWCIIKGKILYRFCHNVFYSLSIVFSYRSTANYFTSVNSTLKRFVRMNTG
jgi:hypothetical protein